MSGHWAADLIGLPYLRGAVGPHEFDCWGLVRHALVIAHRHHLPADMADAPAAIRALGWLPVPEVAPVADGDVVLMRNGAGERHIGIIVQTGVTLGLLHAVEDDGVRFDTLPALPVAGFSRFDIWRHLPCSQP